LKGQIHQGLNQLTTADAVYIRDINSLETLTPEQREKMATILHRVYGSVDLAQKIRSMSARPPTVPTPTPQLRSAATASAGRKRFVHLCYNNIHTQKLLSVLADDALRQDFTHQ